MTDEISGNLGENRTSDRISVFIFRTFPALFFLFSNFCPPDIPGRGTSGVMLFNGIHQTSQGKKTVQGLGSGFSTLHAYARGKMPQKNCGAGFIHLLPPPAGRFNEPLLYVFFSDANINHSGIEGIYFFLTNSHDFLLKIEVKTLGLVNNTRGCS